MKKVNKRKKPVKLVDVKLVETIAAQAGVSKRQARKLAFDADQRIAEALDVPRARIAKKSDEDASSDDRREWAFEDKHDLKKEGGWEP